MQTSWEKEAWQFIQQKTEQNNSRIGAQFPHATDGTHYQCEAPQWWTAGFWPGILWTVYRETNDAALKETAQACEREMDPLLSDVERIDHDAGFMWTLTSVANYKLTHNEASRRRALLAASLLMARFNPQGNFIRAWNEWAIRSDCRGVAIIDCLMNLPLLYWASEETGDPRFRMIAQRHAETVLRCFIRSDGSARHIVVFDPETGEIADHLGGQGFSKESAWSRGCAWAVYGMALSYKYTKKLDFLDAAKRAAHFFTAHVNQGECPPWDFRLPDNPSLRYPDSSAGAIAASGMLLLAKSVPDIEAPLYRRSAEALLKSIYETCGTQNDTDNEGILLHGTGNYPEHRAIDVSLIYGDYFFVEAIAAVNGQEAEFF
ncbi:glycoside hydrolase family 88 protein [Sporolactobacillus shoreicorticis]|uniref:Glycoside hydrolase family 88 protein n=1 Tax=Sporolactobacillus shoreicorticis TaxID=1923877 RepID=A0ABW5S0I7_9BACL|nr:glycoside hydrolase family 88 protein [Sporolactobacillus shoreicorticis]MCO7124726.1 glycoside hydrolase family 88 protein [Sporolactobacillus shoreicorticis]